MKMLVIGLDCAVPELLLGDERLVNLRHLMEVGCYGPVESIIPPTTVPAWISMATSQDPGSLGVYGQSDRVDHTYRAPSLVEARRITAPAIWDQIEKRGKRSIIVGVPPGFRPREGEGISVDWFLNPDMTPNVATHPPEIGLEIQQLLGPPSVDVQGPRSHDKAWLKDRIEELSRKQFAVVRKLLCEHPWDYFQLVEIGLGRLQEGFWKDHDPGHALHETDGPYKDVILDHYRHLDEEIGALLELLTEDTIVLVVSAHGVRKLDGAFCLNEWLIREGLLVLHHYPQVATPFAELDVDWGRTKAWSEGGDCGRLYLNVRGREPRGVIDPDDYESVRGELKARLKAATDAEGRSLQALVFKPEEIYREVNGVAPDLIAQFGGLSWNTIGEVGHQSVHITEDEKLLAGCNPSQQGAFILAGPGLSMQGPVEGVHLLDLAPTLLELGGYDVAGEMQGRSLAAGRPATFGESAPGPMDEEELIRERLRGLGYIA